MKKRITLIMTIIITICVMNVNAQSRTNKTMLEFKSESPKLKSAIGWQKNEKTGKWIENKMSQMTEKFLHIESAIFLKILNGYSFQQLLKTEKITTFFYMNDLEENTNIQVFTKVGKQIKGLIFLYYLLNNMKRLKPRLI